MRRTWQRLRHLLRRRIAQRITRAGLWFTITILLTGVGAFLSANNLIFLILSALLATLVVSGNLNRLTLAGLEVEFEPPEHLFANETASGRIIVRNTKSWFPSFALRLSSSKDDGLREPVFIPLIAPREVVTFYGDVRFRHRGRYRENGFEFSSRFPFGFAERRAAVTLLAEVLVYPELDENALSEPLFVELLGEAEARRQGRGTEFHQLRPYRFEDDARHIDWRSSARHGELYLREFAVEQFDDIELWLDLGGIWFFEFEWAVSVVAAHAFELHRRGLRFTFRTQHCEIAVPEQQDIYGLLKYLAVVEADPVKKFFKDIPAINASKALIYAESKRRAPGALRHRVVCPARLFDD